MQAPFVFAGPAVSEVEFFAGLALIPACFAFLTGCGRIGKLNK
jgi:hypothetical protein